MRNTVNVQDIFSHHHQYVYRMLSLCFVCLGIDDEPEDGPQHYILLLGFHQPHLIVALDAMSVHVANVIKLSSKHSEGQQERHTCEGSERSQSVSPCLDAGKEPSVYSFTCLMNGI